MVTNVLPRKPRIRSMPQLGYPPVLSSTNSIAGLSTRSPPVSSHQLSHLPRRPCRAPSRQKTSFSSSSSSPQRSATIVNTSHSPLQSQESGRLGSRSIIISCRFSKSELNRDVIHSLLFGVLKLFHLSSQVVHQRLDFIALQLRRLLLCLFQNTSRAIGRFHPLDSRFRGSGSANNGPQRSP